MDNNKWPLAKITFIALLCLQVVTVGLILLISHLWNEEAFLKHVRVLMDSVANQSNQSVEGLLDPAERALELAQFVVKSGVITPEKAGNLEPYLLSVLKNNPNLSSLNFGWNNGDLLAVSRLGGWNDPPFTSQFITASATPEEGNRTTTSRQDSFETISQTTDGVVYDVRDEAWFKNAKEGKWEWTPPSYNVPKPRVTVSAPIFAPSGDKLGVLAVSISIDNLSDNLNRNDLSPNSSALVANDENHLISHSDREVGLADENDMSRFEIAGFGDDGIVYALKALYANGDKFVSKEIRRVTYDFHGETYHAVFHSYTKSGLDWTVVIMAPESDFIHGIRSAQNRQILIVVSLSFLITLIAFMVALRFLKPVDELQESILRNQLTGLYNRRALDTLGNGMILEARRKELSVSVAMIDIDRFKRINDTYGHPVGDEVLVTISQRMQNVLKKTDILVRYGGEEFALMMVGANLSEARQICERIRVAVATDPVLTEAGAIQVSVSIGVQEIPEFEEEFASSLSLADQALFVAKRSGRNQVCDPSDLDRPEPTKASSSKPVSA